MGQRVRISRGWDRRHDRLVGQWSVAQSWIGATAAFERVLAPLHLIDYLIDKPMTMLYGVLAER
jgi:hypothetical protein